MTDGIGWRDVKIGSLGRVVTGKTPPSARPELFGEAHPFITPTDIDGVSRTVVTERFIAEEGASAFKNQMIPGGAVCFVCIGATIGKMCIATCRSLTNQQVNSIIVDEASYDPKYVFYALRQIAPDVKGLAGGAATPIISKSSFSDISIRVAPLQQQRRIASILSAYDDLIENNTRRIAILEEMARRIYEEWFVRFRYPGHEGVRMVESELGPVPEGWHRGVLSDVLRNIKASTRAGEHLANRKYVPIECIGRNSLSLSEFRPWTEAQSSLVLFEEDDILFGAMRAYFHKVCIAPFAGVTRSTCFVLRPCNPESHAFGVLTAFADTTVSYAAKHSQGATIPYAVWDGSLSQMPVVIPSEDVLKSFEVRVAPMIAWIKGALLRQQNLRTTRDLLLPKLISGELDVSELPLPEAVAA